MVSHSQDILINISSYIILNDVSGGPLLDREDVDLDFNALAIGAESGASGILSERAVLL